jgi:hypothetical protein
MRAQMGRVLAVFTPDVSLWWLPLLAAVHAMARIELDRILPAGANTPLSS